MYLIVGLGNPGKKYENTRHNMGFQVIDLLSEKYGIKVDQLKFKALVGDGMIGSEKVILIKPQTYMNLSGESVRDAVNFYKVPLENLIVVYDDIDIPTGMIRLRPFGSSGTHNGMRNIIYLLGDDKFPRIRVGTGGEGLENFKGDLASYVIGNVSASEVKILEDSLTRAAESAASIVTDGIQNAMNKYNQKND